MNLTKYVACICEGAAEKAIMEILLDADKLIFKRDDLLEGELLRCRSGKNFEEQHLRKGFTEKITVLRILDSRREQFRLSKAYEHKIEIINVITAPEIEMLVIFNEDKYEEYKKSGKKPSDFCKTDLKYPNVKSTDFVKRYPVPPFLLLPLLGLKSRSICNPVFSSVYFIPAIFLSIVIADWFCISFVMCVYVSSAVSTVLCPRMSASVFTSIPFSNAIVAKVCLIS